MIRKAGLYVQSIFYFLAGLNHFWHPKGYMAIVPAWLPAPLALVYISGIAESILGILLLIPGTRRFAAWAIIFLLIVIFPANIQMTLDYMRSSNPFTWIALLRLPVQLLLIWWAWTYTKWKNSDV